MPSMKVAVCVEKARSMKVSPAEVLPPSPSCMVMPGVLRSASMSVAPPCSRITSWLMTWMVWGVLTNGWFSLGLAALSVL